MAHVLEGLADSFGMTILRGFVRWGVGKRLIALVLLPLLVLSFTVAQLALDRRTAADAADGVVQGVNELRLLVELQSSLYSERSSSELLIRAAALGVPAETAYQMLGLDPADLVADTVTSDELVAALPDLGLDTSRLDAARRGATGGDANAIAIYDELDQAIVDVLLVQINSMSAEAVVTGDADVNLSLDVLADTVVAFSSGADQLTRLSAVWFGGGFEQFESRSQLGLATARYELALERLASSDLDVVLEPSTLLEAGTSVYDEAVLAALRGELNIETALSQIDRLGETFGQGFARNTVLADLVGEAVVRTESAAIAVASDADRDYRMALALGAVAVAVTLLASFWLARSIGRPIKTVTERIRDVGEGRLDGEPLRRSGPPEIADAGQAMNDVMANLRLMERKVRALATCNFEDDALEQPLAGDLGLALAASVNVLSGSILDRNALQERLAHQATHDALTGLANRPAALERLRTALIRSRRHQTGVALLFIDLDGFKRTNDTYGHQVGDEVLVEVGRRIGNAVRSIDLAARLGGDEFVVVLEEVEEVEEAVRLAERIRADLSRPVVVEQGELPVGASVGIAHSDSGDVEPLALLTASDLALYQAKGQDQRVVVFDESLRREVDRRSQLERRLREALETDTGLSLHYQPILDAKTGEVRAVEALARWDAPESISPAVFVPVAERTDLVIDLDRWVLAQAMREAAEWSDLQTAAELRIAVNISGRHLVHPEFVRDVFDALSESGLPPRRLVIEVTETALVLDQVRAAAHLDELRRLGVDVAIDDFGTGFTSISQLRELPFDELKIDQSLVMNLPDGDDREMVRMVMELAGHLGVHTVAEGVETVEQEDFLRELGCTMIQGWLHAPAMTPSDLLAWLAARRRVTGGERDAQDLIDA